jgi:hypothetical protein
MKSRALLCLLLAGCYTGPKPEPLPRGKTVVGIRSDAFTINGKPTYEGRSWNGHKIEGLLMNSRMVQGIFDDLNLETAKRWVYPDTKIWDPDRNTSEFVAAMPEWRAHGLLAITLNLQGGSPEGYSKDQPWHNSGFREDGSLRPGYTERLEKILDRADELGMVVILGLYYFGQDERLRDEGAVLAGVDHALDWLSEHGYRNILIEADNECDGKYDHTILKPARVHQLLQRIHNRGYLAGTSYGGGTIPQSNVVAASDFLLLHGNGVKDPAKIVDMVLRTRAVPGYRAMPVLFNEDDHFDFDQPANNMVASVAEYCSWGYFDPGKNDYNDGYQSPPIRWDLNTPRKKSFFELLKTITGP